MEELAEFKIHWIEEPTSPDDILGHLEISRALKKHGNIKMIKKSFNLSLMLI